MPALATLDHIDDVSRFLSTDTELAYARMASAEHRRRLGQFFTPPKLAELMADWVVEAEPDTILDPAFGTGILTAACVARCPTAVLTAYEIDPFIGRHARRFDRHVTLHEADFLAVPAQPSYGGVIMNPPYIRHREIKDYEIERKIISNHSGCAIPKSANLYVYFTVQALSMLRPGGRAAILIPAEWMSANFAKSFKIFLLNTCLLRQLILFSNCSNVFDDALTTASVLLCEK